MNESPMPTALAPDHPTQHLLDAYAARALRRGLLVRQLTPIIHHPPAPIRTNPLAPLPKYPTSVEDQHSDGWDRVRVEVHGKHALCPDGSYGPSVVVLELYRSDSNPRFRTWRTDRIYSAAPLPNLTTATFPLRSYNQPCFAYTLPTDPTLYYVACYSSVWGTATQSQSGSWHFHPSSHLSAVVPDEPTLTALLVSACSATYALRDSARAARAPENQPQPEPEITPDMRALTLSHILLESSTALDRTLTRLSRLPDPLRTSLLRQIHVSTHLPLPDLISRIRAVLALTADDLPLLLSSVTDTSTAIEFDTDD